jgi:HK97 family phage prohead protease
MSDVRKPAAFADWYVRAHTDSADRPTLVRTFEVTLQEDGDGRTVEGVCVPFNRAAQVADAPDYQPYLEAFMPGAFKAATRAPNRVYLDFEHHLGIGSVLGHGVELAERDDGLYGKFRVLEHPDGDKALSMIREKVLTGMSIMFQPLRSQTVDGVVQRVRAHLDRVSLCRVGAYPEAQVLAVRTASILDDVPARFDPELAARLARFVNVPAALQGEPSEPVSVPPKLQT